ncbi:hypothetical protein K450DRAFT_231863 [Umbelopsis ramanniana AG]|uniref:Zn(2)-C6 fungal-type domain-containing protein n=1 Tax=Umbelopsis ramanniana AG TaxID=1314678 RepID=A0AAD5HGA5_UMBRA|nr:uncharacterized protein K450DRAFT_231863 [Umbelopsis ramanniana AG]KAI8581551.1 hypothetical protein K450DRAFT_231863 [Umbelopsis ramanniana AG]
MSLDFIVEDPLVCKRKRSSRACELCRIRKVRCDGLSPQCTRCQQENKECSYTITRKRGPKSLLRKTNSPNLSRLENESGDYAPDHSTTVKDFDDDHNDYYETEKVKVHYFRYMGRTAIAPGLKRIAVTLRMKRPRAQIQQAKNNSVPISRSPTLSSATALRQLDLDTYTPSRAVVRHLIDLFYVHASFMFPWESKASILSDIEADAASACLVYSMCAIGARYSTHPEVCIPGKERYAYGEPFADKAKRLIIPLLALPSLEVVQSLVLLTHQEFATDRDSALWMYAGMAIRMAQDIGLEKEPVPVRKSDSVKRNSSDADSGNHYRTEALPTYKTERERETRRRVFWTVYFLDRLNSIGLGRRFVMWESSISTALPSYNHELDEMLTLPKDFYDNQEEDYLPLPYKYVAQMMQINATISTTLNFCEEKDQRLAQLEEALKNLQAFNESIPSSFAFTVQNFQVYSERSQAGGFLLVHFWIHALIILVNCPTFLSTNLNSKLPNLGNWDQAYTSAKAISDFLSYVDLLNSSAYLANPFINQCIYVAACVLVKKIQDRLSNEFQLEVYNTLPFNERLDVSSDQASYEICRKALLRMQTYWLGMNWTNVSLEQFSRGVLDVDLCTNDNNENYNEGNIPLLDNGLLRKLREKEKSEAEHNGAGEAATKHTFAAQKSASDENEKKSHPPINVFSTVDDKELLKVLPTHPEASVGQTMDIFSDNYSIEEVVLSDVAFGDALSVGNESLLELISNSNTCNDYI